MTNLGVSLATDVTRAVGLARRAEAAGFDEVWATEFVHRSATIAMGAFTAATSTVGVGSAIAYAFGRSPVVLASETRDLQLLSGGRVILGLGSAQPNRMRDWLGVDPRAPAERMLELVKLLRRLWSEPAVTFEGRFYRVRVEPVGPAAAPPAMTIPVYLAAVNLRMIAVAGRVGDGIVCHPLVSQRILESHVLPTLSAAAHAVGRPVPKIAQMPIVVIDDDIDMARRIAAAQIAFYAQHATYRFVFEHHGHSSIGEALRNAATQNDWSTMIDSVPDDIIDELAAVGSAAEVREKLAVLVPDADHVILHSPSVLASEPVGAGLPSRSYSTNLDAIIDTFGHNN